MPDAGNGLAWRTLSGEVAISQPGRQSESESEEEGLDFCLKFFWVSSLIFFIFFLEIFGFLPGGRWSTRSTVRVRGVGKEGKYRIF